MIVALGVTVLKDRNAHPRDALGNVVVHGERLVVTTYLPSFALRAPDAIQRHRLGSAPRVRVCARAPRVRQVTQANCLGRCVQSTRHSNKEPFMPVDHPPPAVPVAPTARVSALAPQP